jgi:hypothetical protein
MLPSGTETIVTAITLKMASPKIVLLLFSIFVPPFAVFIKVALSL